ncbi:hypothetical protein GG344DRAFT_74013 [Lentinula edodes]|nr:hypothetical protein GG344DRAFT_74013 [Lentinula edodes]
MVIHCAFPATGGSSRTRVWFLFNTPSVLLPLHSRVLSFPPTPSNTSYAAKGRTPTTLIMSGRLHSVASAFLLGTSCSAPMLLAVPLDLGINSYLSIDDVYTSSYIYRMTSTSFVACDDHRVHIDKFPLDSDSYLPNPFTFFFCTQHQGLEANHFVERYTLRASKPNLLWSGNILIMKHARPCTIVAEDSLIDVDADDLRLLKLIVEWLVSKRFDVGPCHYPSPARSRAVIPPMTARRHTYPPHPVLDHRDVREYIFRYCGFKTLCNYSAADSHLRAHVLLFLASRVRSVLSLIFPASSLTPFMEFLERYQSFIVGSAAYQILDPRLEFSLNNFNIVAVRGWRSAWVNALLQLGCVEDFVQPLIRAPFEQYVESHDVFLSPTGVTITITVASGDSITPLILSGDTTLETVAIGSHFMYSFYPDLLEEGISIPLNEGIPFTQHHVNNLNLRSDFHIDNSRWSKPCGMSCPILSRRSRGARGILSFCWGGFVVPQHDCYDPNWGSAARD